MAIKAYETPWTNEIGPWMFPGQVMDAWGKKIERMLNLSSISTFDVPELSKFNEHFVFVYGTLKKNGGNNYLLKDNKYVGRAWTRLKCFVMMDGSAPAVLTDTTDEKKAIQGEIYSVPVSKLKDLDRFESNGLLYKRRRVILDTEQGDEIKAWMYFGMEGVFPRTGAKCPHFIRSKNKLPYYTFTKR
jgi:gamma-glutamylaminecyclotransferase